MSLRVFPPRQRSSLQNDTLVALRAAVLWRRGSLPVSSRGRFMPEAVAGISPRGDCIILNDVRGGCHPGQIKARHRERSVRSDLPIGKGGLLQSLRSFARTPGARYSIDSFGPISGPPKKLPQFLQDRIALSAVELCTRTCGARHRERSVRSDLPIGKGGLLQSLRSFARTCGARYSIDSFGPISGPPKKLPQFLQDRIAPRAVELFAMTVSVISDEVAYKP